METARRDQRRDSGVPGSNFGPWDEVEVDFDFLPRMSTSNAKFDFLKKETPVEKMPKILNKSRPQNRVVRKDPRMDQERVRATTAPLRSSVTQQHQVREHSTQVQEPKYPLLSEPLEQPKLLKRPNSAAMCSPQSHVEEYVRSRSKDKKLLLADAYLPVRNVHRMRQDLASAPTGNRTMQQKAGPIFPRGFQPHVRSLNGLSSTRLYRLPTAKTQLDKLPEVEDLFAKLYRSRGKHIEVLQSTNRRTQAPTSARIARPPARQFNKHRLLRVPSTAPSFHKSSRNSHPENPTRDHNHHQCRWLGKKCYFCRNQDAQSGGSGSRLYG